MTKEKAGRGLGVGLDAAARDGALQGKSEVHRALCRWPQGRYMGCLSFKSLICKMRRKTVPTSRWPHRALIHL